ncbi:RsmB/NOP family class I SAM-dependent RNA methyltransferase [Aureimonas sp. SK2]|uniref:RsmB/NOP family class I SAM-dependent RNA methyltransferase n=1 Tax=Aureimonas sp. SK2 TaxID=3015992 RepID=UPI00244465AE|nr:RsmB/NOP family class I SAM-dependent RNA methyltransferase [Aureimonas sp. SK2]
MTKIAKPRRPSKPAVSRPAAPERPGLASRRVAARLLSAVVDTRTSLDGLTDRGHGHPEFRALDGRDQALVKAILTVALRRRGTIEAVIAACIEKPLPTGAAALRHILHVGVAQILFLDVPDAAAVDLAVSQATADPRVARFAKLVNAVLRRIAREGETLLQGTEDPRLDTPAWLFERWTQAYGEAAALAIAAHHRVPAPLDFTARADPAAVAERIGGDVLPTGTVRLTGGEGLVGELPGFEAGEWWVQDAAAALPARLFGDLKGRRAADLCAAPGGKTAQLAAAGARVTALDISASRLRRLKENFARLGLEADTEVGDLAAFRPDAPFDAVLLDAPCSSTGTIRRHPDVAWTKTPEEVEKLAGVQARMLRQAADLVAPGGLLVFSNCSLDPVEGEAVARDFLAERPDFRCEPVLPDEVPGLAEAVTPEGFLRTTPAMLARGTPEASGLDGFFAARLRRAG